MFSLPQWRFRDNLHAEIEWIGQTVKEIAAAGRFPDVPVTVVSGGRDPPKWLMPAAALQARRAHQQELARLSPRGEQVIAAHSGHFPQLTEPWVVLDALGNLIGRCEIGSARKA